MSTTTIRTASPTDAPALVRLAALDSAAVPDGRVLLGEVDGELWAAASLDGAGLIADPFRASAEVAELLVERVRQLSGQRGGRADVHLARRLTARLT
jgi:hypothetical protein